MTNEEITDRVASHLLNRFQIGGVLGQDGYRHDFFRLFEAAYLNAKQNPSGPCVTADGLLENISERWMLDESEDGKRKRALLRELCDMWDEWQFAWDHYDNQWA